MRATIANTFWAVVAGYAIIWADSLVLESRWFSNCLLAVPREISRPVTIATLVLFLALGGLIPGLIARKYKVLPAIIIAFSAWSIELATNRRYFGAHDAISLSVVTASLLLGGWLTTKLWRQKSQAGLENPSSNAGPPISDPF